MRLVLLILLALILLGAGAWWVWLKPRLPAPDVIEATYAKPVPPHQGSMRVFFLGHSLVNQDMPAMLAQLAPEGHSHNSQLGWGTPMKAHWDDDVEILGFDESNNQPGIFRAAKQAISSGDYDAVVLTEMVELSDAIKYHESVKYLGLWADLAHAGNPEAPIYLYESWHWLTDPKGWEVRLEQDLADLWENRLLLADLARHPDRPVHVIPAGQVLLNFMTEVRNAGGVEGIDGPEDLFGVDQEGKLDPIHMGDLGNYLVALTHYAVLYQKSPEGLPHELQKANGIPAQAPSPEAALLMQKVVWDTVTSYPKTGVPQ
ncbi:hypothetical protein [Tropicibacter sp. Alg240-R139]|uniref:hypothetical protein n=1 Tax=Tropicibacter sp. Alg240-R139 TaxID=2305991 RepID=UPI0013E03E3D|nr:hypothetical protein [Tropicibacter sp. Alg240-R139]